jgi:Spy/CpxP family protein refolding chaperone
MEAIIMNRSNWLGRGIAVGAVVVAFAAGTYAFTQNTNGPGGAFRGRGGFDGPNRRGVAGLLGPLGMSISRLGLTDAQKEQVKHIVQNHAAQVKPLGERAATARQTLQAAMTTGVVDESLIRQRSTELAAAQAELDVARARVFAEVFQTLTPEQQAQFRDLQGKMRERADGARGGGRGPRRGNPSNNGG